MSEATETTSRQSIAEARWKAIVDSAVDAIIVIGARGAIETFNPAAERLFGYSETEVLGKNVNLLMPSPYHEEHDRYIEHYAQTGEQRIIGIGRQVTALRRDGSTFPVHLSVGEMMVDGERHFIGILHDLSIRMGLEEQLREQTAMARLGEMAALIAHEVKNPLTAVRGAIQVIGGRLPADSRDAPIVKEVLARLDALNGLIQDLLLFARPPHPRLAPMDIVSVIALVTDLLSKDPVFKEVVIDVRGSAPVFTGDADLLHIVFQNLFINAAQAMEGRGRIEVTVGGTAASALPNPPIPPESGDATTNGGWITITVADNGPGIPPTVQEKLFRPFQTTKARGTGLGLSTAKRLVEAHQGSIRIDCPEMGGTVVTIHLPVGSPQRPVSS